MNDSLSNKYLALNTSRAVNVEGNVDLRGGETVGGIKHAYKYRWKEEQR